MSARAATTGGLGVGEGLGLGGIVSVGLGEGLGGTVIVKMGKGLGKDVAVWDGAGLMAGVGVPAAGAAQPHKSRLMNRQMESSRIMAIVYPPFFPPERVSSA
jgi:hypothetical protein